MSGLKEFPEHRAEDENSHSLPEGSHGFVSEKRSVSQIAEIFFLRYKTEKNPAGQQKLPLPPLRQTDIAFLIRRFSTWNYSSGLDFYCQVSVSAGIPVGVVDIAELCH